MFIRQFLYIFLPVLTVLIIGLVVHYMLYVKAEKVTLERNDMLNIKLAKIALTNVLDEVTSDLMYLREHNEQRNAFTFSKLANNILQEDFVNFAKNRKVYSQIRFLNLKGEEIVRVNYDENGAKIIPKDQLQLKNKRYYLTKILSLDKDEIYWSPFDLNIENGKVEIPYKPTLRIGTPVFNHQGKQTGALILNFDGKKILSEFARATANISSHIMLLNDNGYWLSNVGNKNEWGFMFGNFDTFGLQHPDEWKTILSTSKTSQAYINDNLITFATLYVQPTHNKPNSNEKSLEQSNLFWKIVAFASTDMIKSSTTNFVKRNYVLYGFIFILAFFGSLLLARLQLINRCHEAQRYYEHGFRQILESVELIAVSMDKNANIVFSNKYFQNLVGISEDNILDRNWFETFVDPTEKAIRFKEFQERFKQQKNISQGESEILTLDGRRRLISWRCTFSYNNENQAETITFIGSDITEQRKTEAELLKASSAVEQSPNTVMITNTLGRIVYVNPKFTQLTGYSKDEVIGKTPRILHSGETSKQEYGQLWNEITQGKEWHGEFHNKKKNGDLYWESARISALKNNEGEITHYLAVKEDITEKKNLEAEVQKRNEEIARNKVLAGVGKMANMIAHDLRNPLSSIKMGLQILQHRSEDCLEEEDVELTHIGLEQVHYMESILSDLLSFSRPDQLRPEWLSIEKLLDMSVSTVQKQLDEYKINLESNYQLGLPTIYADKTKLRQVFSNLILNAAQATTTNLNGASTIKIFTELKINDTGPNIVIKISDNGPGLAPEIVETLFEPFVTTKAKGTGLGLAIVKRIIEQHHGSITIKSPAQKGTIATIELPITSTT